MSDYAKKFVKKVLMVFCMSFVGMFALLCLFMSIRERSSGFEAEQSSDTEDVTGQEESGDTTAQGESAFLPGKRWICTGFYWKMIFGCFPATMWTVG